MGLCLSWDWTGLAYAVPTTVSSYVQLSWWGSGTSWCSQYGNKYSSSPKNKNKKKTKQKEKPQKDCSYHSSKPEVVCNYFLHCTGKHILPQIVSRDRVCQCCFSQKKTTSISNGPRIKTGCQAESRPVMYTVRTISAFSHPQTKSLLIFHCITELKDMVCTGTDHLVEPPCVAQRPGAPHSSPRGNGFVLLLI